MITLSVVRMTNPARAQFDIRYLIIEVSIYIEDWDDTENQENICRHGISFAEAKRIFDGPIVTAVDERFDYGEMREISIGSLAGVVVLSVVHTGRTGVTRIISARRATKTERKLFDGYLKRTLG